MNLILIANTGIPGLSWISSILGILMDYIYRFTCFFSVGDVKISNIGLCIIIFTVVMNILLFPLTLKQQKSSKLMTVMQPELRKIQEKYKDKKDQTSMMRMQTETRAVYEKYGTSMTGGCGQLIIQMVVLFALYQVIYRIPMYVPSVRGFYDTVANQIMSQNGYVEIIQGMITSFKLKGMDPATLDGMVDFLYKLTPAQWSELATTFPAIEDVIKENAAIVESLNNFLGINLSTMPWQGFAPSVTWLIPILAGLTQWYSAKLMTALSPNSGEDNAMAQQMKTMSTTMPLISLVFCFTFPAGIGIYWIVSAVCRIVQQLFINAYLGKKNIEDMIQENVDKANKKRAKKGLPPQNISKNAIQNAKNIEEQIKKEDQALEEKKERAARQVADSEAYYNKNAKPGSLASKVNMVAMYDERQRQKKSGKKNKEENKEISKEEKPEEAKEEN